MDKDFDRHGWWAVVVSDVMEDIRSMIMANAADPNTSMAVFDEEWQKILVALAKGQFEALKQQLERTAEKLSDLPMKRPPETVPTITLTGEIFVRRDALSRQYLTERLADKGFATVCSPIAEWVQYCNYMVDQGISSNGFNIKQRLKLKLRKLFQTRYEKKIKSTLSRSGLVHADPLKVEEFIKNAHPYISPNLAGEAILTIGGSLTEVVSHSCGVIAIGPFGCMPNRLSESILNETMNRADKLATDPKNRQLRTVLAGIEELPFLAIESDGSPFPQLINAKLEAFCLRARRLHERILRGN
jgi:predicted nucleotide-binding protein (sugar kinase/HSP70/actin superfamily)